MKVTLPGLIIPAQMGVTLAAYGITPGIAREPGELHGGVTGIETTGRRRKTADLIMDTGRIDKAVPVLTGYGNDRIAFSYDIAAINAAKIGFFLFLLFTFFGSLFGDCLYLLVCQAAK
jgi:hypothetical protein